MTDEQTKQLLQHIAHWPCDDADDQRFLESVRAVCADHASLRAEVARLREALAPFIRLSLAVEARDARDGLGGLEAEKQVHRLNTDDFRRAAALASLISETEGEDR